MNRICLMGFFIFLVYGKFFYANLEILTNTEEDATSKTTWPILFNYSQFDKGNLAIIPENHTEFRNELIQYYQQGLLQLKQKVTNDTIRLMLPSALDKVLPKYLGKCEAAGEFKIREYTEKLGRIILEYSYKKKMKVAISPEQLKELEELLRQRKFAENFKKILKQSHPIVEDSQLIESGIQKEVDISKISHKSNHNYILMIILITTLVGIFLSKGKFSKNFRSFFDSMFIDPSETKKMERIKEVTLSKIGTFDENTSYKNVKVKISLMEELNGRKIECELVPNDPLNITANIKLLTITDKSSYNKEIEEVTADIYKWKPMTKTFVISAFLIKDIGEFTIKCKMIDL
ncbi:hypothetical protein SNEBB_001738 [Seison nebaliae]|nr:hypothetical protein SNEBB_001738 [Seison nebaliae]